MIQSWLSARVVRDFILHFLHSVVVSFVIGDFCLPGSKEKRSYNIDLSNEYIYYICICSKGFDERRGFIFSQKTPPLLLVK